MRSFRTDGPRTDKQLNMQMWVCYRCSLTFDAIHLANLHANLCGHETVTVNNHLDHCDPS